jgi:hypothetical protein
MKHLFTARNELEAQAIRTALAQQGIEAALHGESSIAGSGGIYAMTTGMRLSLWVREEDLEPARQVLRDIQDRPVAVQGPWQCPSCGERHPGQFTECWRCGRGRDETPEEPVPVLPFDGRLDYESAAPEEADVEMGEIPDEEDRLEETPAGFTCSHCGHVEDRDDIRICPQCGAAGGRAVPE